MASLRVPTFVKLRPVASTLVTAYQATKSQDRYKLQATQLSRAMSLKRRCTGLSLYGCSKFGIGTDCMYADAIAG